MKMHFQSVLFLAARLVLMTSLATTARVMTREQELGDTDKGITNVVADLFMTTENSGVPRVMQPPMFLNLEDESDLAEYRHLKPKSSGSSSRKSSKRSSSSSDPCLHRGRHLKSSKSSTKSSKRSSSSTKSSKKSSTKSSKKSSSCKDPTTSSTDNPLPPTVFCDGNCTLDTGALMSVFLDLTDAFPDLVVAPPFSNATNETSTRALLGNLRRRIQENITRTLFFDGEVELTEGNEEVRRRPDHYTYVIDVSGSVGSGKTSVRGMEIDAITGLDRMLAEEGKVKSVAAVAFASSGAWLPFGDGTNATKITKPGDLKVNETLSWLIDATPPGVGSGTNFQNALQEAGNAVEAALLEPGINETAVVFITDAESGGDFSSDLIETFKNNHTRVHTVTIGGQDCSQAMERVSAETGAGICWKVSDAAELAEKVQDFFFAKRALNSINVTLDSLIDVPVVYSPNIPNDTNGLLPSETPVTYETYDSGLDVNFSQLGKYIHELCIKATTNVTGDPTANCCINFTLASFVENGAIVV